MLVTTLTAGIYYDVLPVEPEFHVLHILTHFIFTILYGRYYYYTSLTPEKTKAREACNLFKDILL